MLRTGTESLKACIVLALCQSVKQFFAPNSPNIPDNAGRKTRTRRRTQTTAKRYAFHANGIRYFCKNVLHETCLIKFKFEKLCEED